MLYETDNNVHTPPGGDTPCNGLYGEVSENRSKSRYMDGVQFSMEGIRKGYLFLTKRVRAWISGRSFVDT